MIRKLAKRIATGVMAAVLALTACVVSASAEDVTYLDSVDVLTATNNKVVKIDQTKGEAWVRFTIKSDTVVTIQTVNEESGLRHPNNTDVYKAIDQNTADTSVNLYKQEKGYASRAGISLKLEKGTYFVKFHHYNYGIKDCGVKITWKEAAATVKTLRVYIPMKVGSKMALSSLVETNDGGTVNATYKSSNTKVGTVSSKGVVTAKAAGKFYVTIKAGTKSVKLYFKVSK